MATSVRVGRRRRGSPSALGSRLAWIFVGFLAASLAALVTRQRTPLLVILALSVLALVLLVLWRFSMPGRATKVLLGLGAGDDESWPRVRRMWRRGPVWHVAWRMPVGVTVSALQHHREAIEQALDVSADFWYERGLVHMRAGTKRLPKRVEFQRFYEQGGR
jgi:hypothetical protein